MAEIPRIYFDTNEGSHRTGYYLVSGRSEKEIAEHGDSIRENTEVLLYMSGELEVKAVLHWDDEVKAWRGDPIEGSLRYLDGSSPSIE